MENEQISHLFPNVCETYTDDDQAAPHLVSVGQPKISSIVTEYCQLSVLDKLSEAQADRLSEILQQAEADSQLSFWLDEADHIVGHMLGLVDVPQTQQALQGLRQRIDQVWIARSLQLQAPLSPAQVPAQTLKKAQAQLKAQGLYTAEVDGVCGEKTRQAFQQLEQKFRAELQLSGLAAALTPEGQVVDTEDAIKLVKEEGVGGDLNDEADLLSLRSWLSFC